MSMTTQLAEALRDIDEACQAGLNSSDPKHWKAALQDIMQSTRAALAAYDAQQAHPATPAGDHTSEPWHVDDMVNLASQRACLTDSADACGFSGSQRAVKLYGPIRCHPAPGTKLYTHPTADAPGVAVDAWLPIESAPRTGRDLILLLTPSRFPQVAFSNTWWTAGFSVECKPTHWHPIPSIAALAPKPEGG